MLTERPARARTRAAASLTVLGLLAGSLAMVVATPVPAGAALDPQPDFDGDGIGDHAVGAAGEGGGAGGVYVFYGANPSTPGRTQYWTQDSTGVRGTAGADDAFGAALAAGDFDGDGFSDLAIGVPGEPIGGRRNAGAVAVLYGSAAGLTATGNELWNQNLGAIQSNAEAGELFGTALAAGDFDGDARDDLAIGAPGEKVGALPGAGATFVLRGCACGLTDVKSQRFTQDTTGVGGTAGRDDNLGFSLAVGRFGGDAVDDLAIGIPGDRVGGYPGAGSVAVLRGRTTAGLTGNDSQLWTEVQVRIDASNGAEDYDFFGFSIAAGDLDLDGTDDLAVGAPGEYSGSIAFAGAVFTIFGDDALLGRPGAQMLTQDSADVPGKDSKYQELGHTVLIAPLGDVNGGDADDFLVVGVPYEDINGVVDAGLVHVFAPGASGVVAAGSDMWSLASDGLLGDPTPGGWFGITLGAADTDGDGQAELLVGSPGEDVDAALGAGAITRFGDVDPAPGTAGSVHWTESTTGVAGRPGRTDFFSSAITSM